MHGYWRIGALELKRELNREHWSKREGGCICEFRPFAGSFDAAAHGCIRAHPRNNGTANRFARKTRKGSTVWCRTTNITELSARNCTARLYTALPSSSTTLFSFLAIWFLKTPFVYFPTFHYLPFSNRISYAAWQRHGRKKAQMDENYVKSARNVADYNGAPRCVTKGCQTEIATRGQRKLKKST